MMSNKAGKCHRSGKTADPAESIMIKVRGAKCLFLKANFTCCECGLKLTLKTYKVSDFGDREIFCTKHVPKQAPLQPAEGIETDRTRHAASLVSNVRMVNEQLHGADGTAGRGAQGATTVDIERTKNATHLTHDVRAVNEQVHGADETVGKGAQGNTTVEIERSLHATHLTHDVRVVNEQIQGAEETVGKGAGTATSVATDAAKQNTKLVSEVRHVNEQLHLG